MYIIQNFTEEVDNHIRTNLEMSFTEVCSLFQIAPKLSRKEFWNQMGNPLLIHEGIGSMKASQGQNKGQIKTGSSLHSFQETKD